MKRGKRRGAMLSPYTGQEASCSVVYELKPCQTGLIPAYSELIWGIKVTAWSKNNSVLSH